MRVFGPFCSTRRLIVSAYLLFRPACTGPADPCEGTVCDPGAVCVAGTCRSLCSNDEECNSGFCRDGVCDSAGFGDSRSGDPDFGDPSFGDSNLGDPSFGDFSLGDLSSGDSSLGDPGFGGDGNGNGGGDTLVVTPLNYPEVPLPWLFGGANHHRIYTQLDVDPILPPQGGVPVQADAAAQINAMRSAGLRVLRVLLHQEQQVPWEIPVVTYTFEDPIGTYHDVSLDWIDQLMPLLYGDPSDPFDDIKLVVCLLNHLQGTPTGDVEEELYLGAYGETGFYTQTAAKSAFKDRISHILHHRNPYLGNTAWKDLDIIAAWEPMNEPGLHTLGEAAQTNASDLGAWLQEIAATIKSIDGDGTPVATGMTAREAAIGDDVPALIAALGGPVGGVDIYTVHFYDQPSNLPNLVQSIRDSLVGTSHRIWIEEFGETRTGSIPTAYVTDGVLDTITTERLPWLFWRMGIRSDNNTWSRFVWDADWTTISVAASALQARIEDFEGNFAFRITRNDLSPLSVSSVPSSARGQSLLWVMDDGYLDLRYKHDAPIDVTGTAIPFRARTSAASMSIEIQLKNNESYSGPNPFVTVTPEWRYFQLPIRDFQTTAGGFDPTLFDSIIFFFKDGSDAGVEFYLDDLWLW